MAELNRTAGRWGDERYCYFIAIKPHSQQSYEKEITEQMIATAGKSFNPSDKYAYFIASNIDRMKQGAPAHDHLLTAVNELKNETDMAHVEGWIGEGKKVLIDSGIYNLAMEHARHHGASHNEALNLAPAEIDGFDELLERYCQVIDRFGDRTWGYIELDQGGRENKIKTRAMLEGRGYRPIPVYHPFADGWDYFDYLAERYDRICFGNVVQADRTERLRLVATAWERHRKYPHLWIHLLGLTPNEWLYSLPINSGDSSSWLSVVRWSGYIERAAGATVGHLPRNFQYALGSDSHGPRGSRRATRMAAYGAYMLQLNWRNHLLALEEMGCEIYPPVDLAAAAAETKGKA